MKIRDLQPGDLYNTKRNNTTRVLLRFSPTKDRCMYCSVHSRYTSGEYTDDEVLFVRHSLIQDVTYSLTFFQKIKLLWKRIH